MTSNQPKKHGFIDTIEETLLAILLGAMTLITFANVVVRYIFAAPWFGSVTEAFSLPTNMLWALEATVYLFAWMVLLGASYCVKINAHLGVDVLVKLFGEGARRALTLTAVLCCIVFTALVLVGSWNYWAPFANIPPIPNLYNDYIAGPLGLGEIKNQWREQGFYEVESIVMPDTLRFMEGMFNYDERYTYIPKMIPYVILPISMALLLFRFLQAGKRVWNGTQEMVIANHEAEDDIEEAAERAAAEVK